MSEDAEALRSRIERLERTVRELERRLPPENAPPAVHHPPPPGAAADSTGRPDPDSPRGAHQPPATRPAGRAPGADDPTEAPEPAPSTALPGSSPVSADPSSPAGQSTVRDAADAAPRWDSFGEQWLGRVGVAFVLLALSFLFKLAFDRGWITPPLRMVFGLAVGTALLGAGLRLSGSRRRYAQVLMGGALGVFYLVGFAGYQWYGLLSHPVAFAYMVGVAVLALVLGVRQDQETLATIGAMGGLSTPFLLYTEQGSVSGLMIYLTVLLAGIGALQARKGWLVLLSTLVAGGAAVLAVAVTQGEAADRWAVLLGTGVWWLTVGVSPLLRWWVLSAGGARDPGPAGPWSPETDEQIQEILARVLGVGCSLGAAAVVAALLDLGNEASGAMIVALGGVFVLVAVLAAPVRAAAAEIALVLVPVGTFMGLDGPTAFFVLAVEVAVIHYAAGGAALPGLHRIAQTLAAVLGLWLFAGAWGRLDADPFDTWAVSTLASIVLLFAASFQLEDRTRRGAYHLGLYVALLYWLAAELSLVDRGPALVSLSWGGLGVVLLILGWRRASRELQRTGLATLAVTAAKLVLIDMVQLDMVLRIGVFLGFGTAFLALSYLINRAAAP